MPESSAAFSIAIRSGRRSPDGGWLDAVKSSGVTANAHVAFASACAIDSPAANIFSPNIGPVGEISKRNARALSESSVSLASTTKHAPPSWRYAMSPSRI